MKRLSLLLGIGTCLLAACGPGKKVVTKHVTLDTIRVVAQNNPIDLYRAAATRTWDIVNTRAALSFNWPLKTADSREWIKLHPYFYATDTLVLDAKGMRIDSVMLMAGQTLQPLNYAYKGDSLKIRFNRRYYTADTIQLYLRYTAMPYSIASGGSAAITEDRGLYFINTDGKIPGKPRQIWTQGETESNSHWLITIDKPNTRFTTQLELSVPDTMQTLSNGSLVSSKRHGNMRTDIWRMDIPIQAYAVMFAIGRYDILKDSWKSKDVNYYVEPAYAPSGRLIFKHTPEMIDYFSKITGVSYPWNKYDQVIVRDYVSGAMENTTASLFGEFMNQTAREIADHDYEDVVSHELFHQWFGDYVTCESWSNITVNESFANYSEKLWRYYKYGQASGDQLYYDDLRNYLAAAEKNDPPLVRFHYADREDVFDRISYEKGGAILHYMHQLMGDSAFFKSMNIYLTKNALHSAEAQNWRLAVEEATGQDWNWFFNQWYYHDGHPELHVTYKRTDTALLVTVKQEQADSNFIFHMPLKAELIYGNSKQIIDFNVEHRNQTFSYPVKNGEVPVFVPDCYHWMPGRIKDDKRMSEWIAEYNNSNDYINKRISLSAVAYAKAADSAEICTLLGLGLKDSLASIREFTVRLLDVLKKEPKLISTWSQHIQMMALNDGSNKVRAAAFDLLGDWKVTAAKEIMIGAITDSSYEVAGDALDALDDFDSVTAYKYAMKMVNTHPQGSLLYTIWDAIGKQGKEDDVAIYQKEAPYIYGTKKFQFAQGLHVYLLAVKNDVSFDEGVATLASLIYNENIKQYRLGLSSFLFDIAKNYREKAGKDKSEAAAHDKQRVELVRSYIQKIMDAETDPENKTKYSEMYKDLTS